ncbi:UDP:flavonoid glycosyltransferase YjiC, YdhE family [Amycolatopsis xylanica]|uniref:UDP:flavonoid glycosyltransferase YjiC, YdhE family n=1 Tax=Amycolatopsis xylanica TaxID=589385 RepID=A0A1H2W3G0_9PSEU|nr:nucleotide disphospho-sugar-binding domain-containing protein [Amycolatopsis xylanica]SDW75036.1 UDP:flavonoid glycosyltransferase YjiC, YdhE family [Amycolatopsis xylanica]
MRVAIVAGADPGHVFPAIALCLRFLEAGDVPTLCTVDPWVDAAAELGIGVIRLNGLVPGREPDLGRALHERAAMLAPALAPLLADLEPDLVVCDVIAQGGGMAAELAGVPWAQLSPHPLYEPSRGLPPIGTGLAAGVGVAGKLRDAALRVAASRSIRRGDKQRARARRSIGLAERGPGPVVRLIATLPALEVPRPDWPSNAHVVGPLLWEASQRRLAPPPGDEPLVVIAPSTVSSGTAGLAELALEALRDMGVRAVVSTFGPSPALPEWARAGQGRQDELLREAAVVVCGGGHGLLAKALLAKVPAVLVPGGGDQWEMANRVARHGSGVLVRPSTVDTLRDAVTRVLGDPRFAAAAALAGASVADVLDPVEVCRAALAS